MPGSCSDIGVGLRAYLGSRWTGYTGPGGEQVQGRAGYLQWRIPLFGIERKSQKRPDFNYNGLRDLNPLNLPNKKQRGARNRKQKIDTNPKMRAT